MNSMVVSSRLADTGGLGNAGAAWIFTKPGYTWEYEAKLTASDKAGGNEFGYSCSLYGDTVVVGSRVDNEGSAYVYTKSGTTWSEIQKLTSSDKAGSDWFGYSCAIYEDTIAVTSLLDNYASVSDGGSLYIFTRSGTTWSEIQKLTTSDAANNDWLGGSCSIYQDTLVVGKHGDSVPTSDEGSAYIFTRSGTTWTEQAKLTISEGTVNNRFGNACSIYGDTVVVSSGIIDVTGVDEGAAYIFTRSGTTWTQEAKLTASDKADSDQFGYSCSLYENNVVIGARHDDVPTNNEGSVYVYERTGTTWNEIKKITASDISSSDTFGTSCAIYQNTIAVFANGEDEVANNAGAGYIFDYERESPNVVSILAEIKEIQKITATDAVSGDYMGISQCSMHMDSLVVSSYYADPGGLADAGAAWIFAKSGDTWVYEAKLTASDKAAGDNFGISCSIYGDTAVVGAHLDDAPTNNEGSAYVFTRSGTTWSEIQKLTASDKTVADQFGHSCSVYEDTIIVGANFEDPGGISGAGSAYVFMRSGTTWSEIQKLTASDKLGSDFFGFSCAIYQDTVVIGVYGDNGTTNNEGSAYIFTRSGTTWTEQAKLTATDGKINDQFGRACSIYGDTVVVSSYLIDIVEADEGSAYIYTRSGTTWTLERKLTAPDKADNDQFGYSCSIYEDTVVIGVRLDDLPTNDEGSAYVYERTGTTWNEIKKITASDELNGDFFGESCAIYGDTIVAFAPRSDVPVANAGVGYIFNVQRIAGPPDVSRVALEDKGDRALLVSNGEKWYLM